MKGRRQEKRRMREKNQRKKEEEERRKKRNKQKGEKKMKTKSEGKAKKKFSVLKSMHVQEWPGRGARGGGEGTPSHRLSASFFFFIAAETRAQTLTSTDLVSNTITDTHRQHKIHIHTHALTLHRK